MTTRATHTYTTIEIPRAVYAAVRALIEAADHPHAVHLDKDGETLDLHGLAFRSRGGTPEEHIVIGTLLSRTTHEGRIEFSMNGELAQLELSKAREIVGMLQSAIEASVSDQLIYQFLVEKVGLSPDKAVYALADFREMRQGSKDTVNPS